jgi:hypothetical protein
VAFSGASVLGMAKNGDGEDSMIPGPISEPQLCCAEIIQGLFRRPAPFIGKRLHLNQGVNRCRDLFYIVEIVSGPQVDRRSSPDTHNASSVSDGRGQKGLNNVS